MTLSFWLILLLPVVLNIKGDLAIFVFFAMNSVLCYFMQYAKVHIQIAASVAGYGDRMDELKEEGSTLKDAFEVYIEQVNPEEVEHFIPKPIHYAANSSVGICIIGIIFGVVQIARALM
ncbi:hypothetical protein [Desulfoscipio gibsoniae]|uniref:DUF3899 domain-containing protein n=1 Tax=Desulfoscipio gibsoniae DSM 7213 TaxID=767817 RepID=R4KKN2_9FIRM|nr:hypothetical protein [Desulfoscipio gibsoniae]AGL03773.1 hypothetical protein Desgi_4545 [Desulfoscipio gibsoniae DSM 7213]